MRRTGRQKECVMHERPLSIVHSNEPCQTNLCHQNHRMINVAKRKKQLSHAANGMFCNQVN